MPDFIPDSLARFVFDVVFRKGAEDDKYVAQMKSSAGTAVFFAEKADKRHWVQVGRAAERFQLAATLRDIRTAFVNQPVEAVAHFA